MSTFLEIENKYALNIFARRNVALVRGLNARVWDENGKEYIDCVSGNGVANIGHCNEKIIEAINKQSQRLLICSNIFHNDQRALLLEKLVQLTPANLNKVFLCNSGTESVEAALKFARSVTGKTDFICAMRSFHGRTMGALSATYNVKYKKDFEPLVPGFHFVPFNNAEKLSQQINQDTAAVLLEIVQGEGGVHIGNREYFQQVQKLCHENGILLIIDEVQTGFCRTGKMFACEHFDVRPDMLCLSKSIAGGIPMGAVLCSDKIEIAVGQHGTTFGGNPLACAAALAAIDYMQENNLAEQAQNKGNYFTEKFKQFNLQRVRKVRQLGLMIGIELKEKSQPFIEILVGEGVLALPAGATVLRLLPPLTIGYDDLDFVLEKIKLVLSDK
jgi:acetylornithine/LysW-gamma-L-lysine aminotransferase